ncbi:MAG TPA: hypothetical protein VJ983_10765, partial [candidate division Zixibacteria bacterium]|nr:hypothetical protein [candidate division Zixibacteria bacterium]
MKRRKMERNIRRDRGDKFDQPGNVLPRVVLSRNHEIRKLQVNSGFEYRPYRFEHRLELSF